MSYLIGTKAVVDAMQALDTRARGLPLPGVHVGGGRHVPMTDDPQSPGWTRQHDTPRKHPDRDDWAYRVTGIPTDRLNQVERNKVEQAKAAAQEIDATWEAKT